MVNKLIGYLIALVGLLGLGISSFPDIQKMIPFTLPAVLTGKYVIIGSLILVGIGVVLSLSKSSGSRHVKQASEEVPIYEGEGKKKKIVGYQRA